MPNVQQAPCLGQKKCSHLWGTNSLKCSSSLPPQNGPAVPKGCQQRRRHTQYTHSTRSTCQCCGTAAAEGKIRQKRQDAYLVHTAQRYKTWYGTVLPFEERSDQHQQGRAGPAKTSFYIRPALSQPFEALIPPNLAAVLLGPQRIRRPSYFGIRFDFVEKYKGKPISRKSPSNVNTKINTKKTDNRSPLVLAVNIPREMPHAQKPFLTPNSISIEG